MSRTKHVWTRGIQEEKGELGRGTDTCIIDANTVLAPDAGPKVFGASVKPW